MLTIAAAALGGCSWGEPEIGAPAPTPTASTARPAPRPAPTATVRTPAPRASATTSTPAPGMAMVKMALPTGDLSNSVLSLEKTAPKEVLVGKAFTYQIKLTNLTNAAIKGVTLTGKLSDNVTLTGTAPKGQITGSHSVWSVGVLGPKQSKTFAMQGAAKATGTLIGCSDVKFDMPQVCLPIKAVQPAVKIRKIAPATVLLCENIVSKIIVTNTGTGTATNIRVQDTLPAGVTTVDGKAAAAFDFGDIPPGQARQVTVTTKASKVGEFTNTARVTGDGGLTAQASATTTVVVPQLAVDVTGPKTRFAGRTATYTITVANNGTADARDTVLTGSIPAGATLLTASAQGAASGGQITWKLGTIKAGSAKKVTVSTKMTQQGVVRVSAAATAYCSKASGQTVTTVRGIPAILLECVDLEDPIEVGANETYVITVTNQGSAVGTNIVIVCTLPDEQTFVSGTGPTKGVSEGKTVTFAPLAKLAPKAKTTYKVVVKGVKAGDVRFKVALTSDQMTSPAGETESTHQYSDE